MSILGFAILRPRIETKKKAIDSFQNVKVSRAYSIALPSAEGRVSNAWRASINVKTHTHRDTSHTCRKVLYLQVHFSKPWFDQVQLLEVIRCTFAGRRRSFVGYLAGMTLQYLFLLSATWPPLVVTQSLSWDEPWGMRWKFVSLILGFGCEECTFDYLWLRCAWKVVVCIWAQE